MSPLSQLDAALAAVDRVDRITIDITDTGFVWRLGADGREIFAGDAGPDQVAPMLQATEILINTELRIPRTQLVRVTLN